MTTIRVSQLVFARVEPICSRKGKRGYQTVYHSPGLNETIVREIEQHVQCFNFAGHPNDDDYGDLERLQFIHLNDGRILLSRSVPAAHTTYIDMGNRPMCFIAHCLVLTRDEFQILKNDPFAAFDQGHSVFVDDPETLYARFVAPPEDEVQPLASLEVRARQHTLAGNDGGQWSDAEVKKLLRLAVAAKSIVDRQESVVLLGDDSDEAANALRLMFRFLKDDKARFHCTFSTHVDGCPVPPGQLWAIGSKRRKGPQCWDVDLASHQVLRCPDGGGVGSESPFGVWLNYALAARSVDEVFEQSFAVECLCQAYQDESPLGDEQAIPADLCGEFHRLFPELVRARVHDQISKLTTRSIGTALTELLERELSSAEFTLLGARERDEAGVAELAVGWLLAGYLSQRPPRLSRADWSALRDLARRTRTWPLLHWSSTLGAPNWLGTSHQRDRDAALDAMDEEKFRLTLSLIDTIPLPEFVSARNLDPLLQQVAERRDPPRTMLRMMKRVLALACPVKDMSCFQNYVTALRPSEANKLFQQVKRRLEDTDPQFVRALQHRAKEEEPRGAWQKWLHFPSHHLG